MAECLLDKRADGVALITLNRPERRNATSLQMQTLLGDYLRDCEQDSAVRCVVLTGAGSAFCAGGDISGMKERRQAADGSDSGMAALDQRLQALRVWQDRGVLRLHVMAKPTVALINGPAIGAGFSLALACDIRIMSGTAKVSAGFARMGLSGDLGGTYFLSKLVSTAVARELCFSGEVMDAGRALALGLVNRVASHDRLMEDGLAYAAELAAGPTSAFGRIKANLNFAWNASVQEALDFESANMIVGSLSRDHREAVAAFVEKRPPKFTGS